jgi:hypothetical protein
VASGANAANAASWANTAYAIVQRDGTGSFSAENVTLAGTLTLPNNGVPGTIYVNSNPTLIDYGFLNGGSFYVGEAGNTTSSGAYDVGVGNNALHSVTTASWNTAVGEQALYANMVGPYNTAVGYQALYSNTSSDNTAVGYGALYANTIGNNNTANGGGALGNNTIGIGNTANGVGALGNNTNGSFSCAFGVASLQHNLSGTNNAAYGSTSLANNTTGSYNTTIGGQALLQNISGSNNIALGYQAGYYITGSSNIDIGNQGNSGENNIIRIGTWQTATYLVGTVYANGVALTSDRNAKENFTIVSGREVLAKVASLPVTEWNYKKDSKEVQHIGPMAQDFQAAFGLSGGDDKHISVVDEGGVALAAIQGLNQKLEEKDAEITELKARLDRLEQAVSGK